MERRFFTRPANVSRILATLALGGLVIGCKHEPSMASKSAAAYQTAVEQGLPIGSGHGAHGGSEHTEATSGTPEGAAGHEHGSGDGPSEHPVPNAEVAADAESSRTSSTGHSHSAGSDPPTASAQHPTHARGRPTVADSKPRSPKAAMPAAGPADSSAAEDASPAPAMAHGAMNHGTAAAPPVPSSAPTSSAELGQLNPTRTLATDELDRTVPPPRGSGTGAGSEHQGHAVHNSATGLEAEARGAVRARSDTAEPAFTCTMHPEVVSAIPGTCTKCGMTLVRKEKP